MCWYSTLQPFWIGYQHVTVIRSQDHSTGTLLRSGSVLVVILCPHEKGTGAILFLGEGIWCSTVLRRRNWCSTVLRRRDLVLYCSQEKKTGALLLSRRKKLELHCSQDKGSGALLFSGERNRCTTVLRRRDLVLYCSQEKATGVILLSRRKKLVLHCSQDKGSGALLFSGERNRCTTVLSRRKKVLYCF